MSIDLSNKKIPKEAIQALKTIAELLDNMLIGVYLYGSAVMGGLRMNSDVDILVITNQSLSEKTRRNLTNRLMLISGKIGNIKDMRPLEVTVINQKDIVPWHFPPKYEFISLLHNPQNLVLVRFYKLIFSSFPPPIIKFVYLGHTK